MKLRKYIISMTMGAALAASMLSGCGKSDQAPEPEATPTAEPVESKPPKEAEPTEVPAEQRDISELSLKEAYKDYFSMGVAANSWQLADDSMAAMICKDYSSITMENEMKPDFVLDYDATVNSEDGLPEINTERMDDIMTMAEDLGLKMRGHTLIWQNQTPNWLFCKKYDNTKGYVDRETMLERMEAYIKKVITFAKEKHPGTVYAWDVVNEAVSDGDDLLKTDNPWYEIIGEDFVEKAFEFARKYASDDMKLFYNDYSCTDTRKSKKIYEVISKIYEQGNLDGLGMQSHYDVKYYAPASLQSVLYKYSQLEGLEIQLTEMDFHYNDNSEESMQDQATKYKEIFEILVDMDKNGFANITNVTFWGLGDSFTWLTGFKGEDSYPLLFDQDNQPKPCYYSIIDAANS